MNTRDDRVFITFIEIHNLGGIEHFSCELDQLVLVVGENGAGKSSVLGSIRNVFEGGGDPDLIRQGCERGEVTIKLSNGYTAWKELRKDGFELQVTNPSGGIIKREATWLKEMAPQLSWDPIGFLEQEPRKKADFLLKNLPLMFEPDEVNAAAGSAIYEAINLQDLNALRDARYRERSTLNIKVDNLKGSIATLGASLASGPELDYRTQLDVLRGERDDLTLSIVETERAINKQAQDTKDGLRKSASDKVQALEQQIAKITADLASDMATVDALTAEELKARTAEASEKAEKLSGEIATADAKMIAQQQAVGVRNVIAQQKQELAGHVTAEIQITDRIEAIDKLKAQKLKTLPIPGLDIKIDTFGRPVILIEGIPLEKLNRQQQIFVAMQSVRPAQGKLGVMLCEVAELDDAHVEMIADAAKKAKRQMILARWENKVPLTVAGSMEELKKIRKSRNGKEPA